MNLGELKSAFRSAVMDMVKPYLWSEDEVTEYAAEAEMEACRRAHLIVDSTSDLASATVSAGDPAVPYDGRIIRVRRARLASQSRPLTILVQRALDESVPGWESAAASTPRVLIPDWETGSYRLYPPPVLDDTLLMSVVREPLNELAADDDTPEINRRYHRSLINWMRFRAYSKPDPDTANPGLAKEALALFEGEFGEKSRAIDEHWANEQYYDVGDFT